MSSEAYSNSAKTGWRFDTLQVHSGLEDTAFGECSIPVYTSASFRYDSSTSENFAGGAGRQQQHIYSRMSNPSNVALERRIAALEDGVGALSFSCGNSAITAVVMSLARLGDNALVSSYTHGGTFHQFSILLPQLGIEARFCDTNDMGKVEQLIDDRTKFIFTESIGNPRFSVADMEPLAALAHTYQIPVVVDATFTASGYFCQPAKFGVDLLIHSATKWIGGNGTTLGGLVVDTGRSDWQANKARFPQLHGMRPGREGLEESLYEKHGNGAYMRFLRWDLLRDTGACLSPQAAQQLFIGVETLSLRCEREARNADQLARWLNAHPRVAWVRYLGFRDHPSHALASKYLQNGFGTVLTFGLKGGAAEGLKLADAFKIIVNTGHVGDAKTTICHQWSTTHRQCTNEENETLGVYEDLFRLSVGIEHIDDIIGDFAQAFVKVPSSMTTM